MLNTIKNKKFRGIFAAAALAVSSLAFANNAGATCIGDWYECKDHVDEAFDICTDNAAADYAQCIQGVLNTCETIRSGGLVSEGGSDVGGQSCQEGLDECRIQWDIDLERCMWERDDGLTRCDNIWEECVLEHIIIPWGG